jgi:hypothetical protein
MAQSFALWPALTSARERLALQCYLDSIEKADEEQQASIDQSAVQAALDKLKQHPEPEAGLMLMRQTPSRRTTCRPPLTRNMR